MAAAHARRLLAAHNLAIADITAAGRPERADTVETAAPRKLPKWVRHLSAGVSNAFDCQAVHHPATGRLTFIGVGADVQVAAYTFSYLDRTVRKLCAAYLKQHPGTTAAGRQRELLRHSYYLGAVTTITRLLQEQKRQTPVTPGALVPVKEALIRKSMDELGALRTVRSRTSFINASAYGRGQADGEKIRVHKGVQHWGKALGSIPER